MAVIEIFKRVFKDNGIKILTPKLVFRGYDGMFVYTYKKGFDYYQDGVIKNIRVISNSRDFWLWKSDPNEATITNYVTCNKLIKEKIIYSFFHQSENNKTYEFSEIIPSNMIYKSIKDIAKKNI